MAGLADLDPEVFDEMDNAVADIRRADYQTFQRPLKRLGRLMHTPGLDELTQCLRAAVDFDAFSTAGEGTGGSMVGSQILDWPEDQEQSFGLTLELIERMAADPDWAVNFGHSFFYSDKRIVSGIHNIADQVLDPFARDFRRYVARKLEGVRPARSAPSAAKRVFLVHGHDDAARETVARFLERVGFEVIILHEQANRGRTIIEKFEAHSDVGFAVVLLTPDDEGNAKGKGPAQPRARQNVVLELGYFIGHLGRDRVCALKRGEVEIPSDFVGVVYTTFDDAGGWRRELGNELQAAGYEIDWNKVMRS